MTSVTYNLDIPDAPNNPSVDQPKMKTNTNAVNTLIGRDHYNFNAANGGYHKDIHVIARTGNPTSVATTPRNFILFSKEDTPDTTNGVADTQLFGQTALGGVSQLTGNFASQQGYCWVGGILISWGRATIPGASVTHASGTVTFKDRGATPSTIPFPNDCFVVLVSLGVTGPGVLVKDANIAVSTISKTSFAWTFNAGGTGNAQFPDFRWIAIGN